MGTLDMLIEARKNGKTYWANNNGKGLAYSNKYGFHDIDTKKPWEGCSFAKLNDLMDSLHEWHVPQVDWYKVPIDTKVIVTFSTGTQVHRHFAGVHDGEIYFWIDGLTSFTAEGKQNRMNRVYSNEYIQIAGRIGGWIRTD